MAWCLTKQGLDKFREGLKSGDIDPDKLFDMPPEVRHAFLAERFGEASAKEMNAIFEGKTLLKDQVRGLKSFMNRVGEYAVKNGVVSPKEIKSALQKTIDKIEKLESVLSPAKIEEYKKDFISKTFGGEVSYEKGQAVLALSKQIIKNKIIAESVINRPGYDKLDLKHETKAEKLARVEYGIGQAVLKELLTKIKTGETGEEGLKSILGDFYHAFKNPKTLPTFVGNLSKSVVASLDDSFFLNQGINALFDPQTTGKWLGAFGQSFGDMYAAAKGGDPILGLKGEIYSRPNALNNAYDIAKLDIGIKTEEAIPTAIPEKLPVIGRFFKISNAAYNGAALRLRADIFDLWYRENVKKGIDMADKANLISLGRRANAFTGRGYTKTAGDSVNALLFAKKFLKSKADVLTMHLLDKEVTRADKWKSAKSLAKIVGLSYALLGLANAIKPGSGETDMRSTNYGKIKIGDEWHATPLYFAGIPTLIARLVPSYVNGRLGCWSKDKNGKWSALLLFKNNDLTQPVVSGYGKTTGVDLVENFFENKAAPAVRAFIDFYTGHDFEGHRSTPLNIGKNLITPITPGKIWKILHNVKEKVPGLNSFITFIGG